MKAKRNYKDSLFRRIFNNKRELLSLYNALEGTSYDDPSAIRITTLKGTFFNDLKNDISFEIGGRFVVLLEHQSTLNGNMPLRCLLYIAKLYQEQIASGELYREAMIKIPAPKFYVFYNGLKAEEERRGMRLSDAFKGEGMLELIVTAYNINAGHSAELMERCRTLRDYSLFVAQVRKEYGKGLSLGEAIRAAIKYSCEHDILKEFLEANMREVYDMVSMKWDAELAHKVWREEAMEMGRAEGMEQGLEQGLEQGREKSTFEMAVKMLKENLDHALISRITGLSEERLANMAAANNIA